MQPFATTDTLIWSTAGGGSQQNIEQVPTAAQFAVTSTATTALGPFDVHGYRALWLEVILASFTGGTTPSFQPELDAVDDDTTGTGPGGANLLPLWKPTAATAATKWLEIVGRGQGAAPTIAGWTVGVVPVSAGPFVVFNWTVVGAPTAIAARLFLYGLH